MRGSKRRSTVVWWVFGFGRTNKRLQGVGKAWGRRGSPVGPAGMAPPLRDHAKSPPTTPAPPALSGTPQRSVRLPFAARPGGALILTLPCRAARLPPV